MHAFRTTSIALLASLALAFALPYAAQAAAQIELAQPAPVQVVYGTRTRLVGKLTDAGGSVAGQTIALWANAFPFTGPERLLGSTQTKSDGSFSFSVKPDVRTTYIAQLESDTSIVSGGSTVIVSPRATTFCTNCPPRAPARGKPLVLRERVTLHFSQAHPLADRGVYVYEALNGAKIFTRVRIVRIAATGAGQVGATFRLVLPHATTTFTIVTCAVDRPSRDGYGRDLPVHTCGARTMRRGIYEG